MFFLFLMQNVQHALCYQKPKIAQAIIALDSWKWHLKKNNQENQFFDWMVAKGQA